MQVRFAERGYAREKPGDRALQILKAGAAGDRERRSAADVVSLYDGARAAEIERRQAFSTPIDRAVDACLVQRGSGRTIIAGYPWFTDWGRDTLIAVRGLCITTNRLADARDILVEWAATVSEGMLPNRFPDRGAAPEFNSVDASLWYAIATHELLHAAKNDPATVAPASCCDEPSTRVSPGSQGWTRNRATHERPQRLLMPLEMMNIRPEWKPWMPLQADVMRKSIVPSPSTSPMPTASNPKVSPGVRQV